MFYSHENFKIHLLAALVVHAAGFYYSVALRDWAVLWICITVVLAAEVFNTAVEEIINLLHPEHHPKAGLIKDIAAAAVLLTAIGSVVCGLLIFWPYVFA
ncbi:MAG: diacylglycerol kinase family protein [Bacteroidetes bacterium]|nr:MAG: diacylglycerol kinase family protein [Bacteroidota bacterium]